MATTSIGEITATLELKDKLTPQLKIAQTEVAKFDKQVTDLANHLTNNGLKPLPPMIDPDQQRKLEAFEARMADLATSTRSASTAGQEFLGGFAKSLVTGAVLGAAGTITGMAWAAGELATNLYQAEAASGIAATKLDELSRKGVPAGVALNDIQKAALDLEKKLAKGDDSVTGAVKALGVSIENMPRGEAFLQVLDRLSKIEDPAKRATAAIQTLGSADLLPLIAKLKDAESASNSMTAAQIKGLADAKAAFGEWKDNAIRDVGSVLGMLTSTEGFLDGVLQRLGMWGQNLLGAKEFFDSLPGKLDAARQAAGLGFSEGAPKGLAVFEVPDLSIRKADEFKGVMADLNKETEKAITQWEAHNKKITAMADILSGRDLAGRVDELSQAMALAEKTGGLTQYQFELVAKQAKEMRDQGAVLTPVLDDMADGFEILTFNLKTAKAGLDLLPRTLETLTKVTWDSHPAIYQFNQDVDRMLKISAAGFGPASINAMKGWGTVVKELPAPPITPWETWGAVVGRTIQDVFYAAQNGAAGLGRFFSDFARDFVSTALDIMVPGLGQLVNYAWPLIEAGLKKIWDGIQAFWGKVKGFFNFFGSGTGAQTPVDGFNPNDPNNPFYGREDPGNPNPTPSLPEGGSSGDMYVPSEGLTPYEEYLRQRKAVYGFAGGTHGQYLDFGSGTPVVLHGKERVMTEGESAGSPSIVFNVYTTVADRDGLRQLVYGDIAAMLKDALANNTRGARTQFRHALGVA